ncbi:MAG: response regulator [Nitrospinae bacterium]|nr:response regulator [Nitrospinota bacterium]
MAESAQGALRLVLADDDEIVREVYRYALPADGFEVRLASDGAEAFQLYLEWQPQMMVLDIQMPEMSGYALLKRIREHEKGWDKPTAIVMATAMSDKSDIMDCLQLGIQGYVVKPIRPEEIASRLASYYQAFIEKREGR